MWSRFWSWMSDEEGWKAVSGAVYLLICVFDFVLVPSWIGLTRIGDPLHMLDIEQLGQLAPAVQLEVVKSLSYQHEPFTLKGGGLFHLAFGALLTGSAIAGKRINKE